MPGIDAIGGQVCQRTMFLFLNNFILRKRAHEAVSLVLTPSLCSSRTHLATTERISKWMRLSRISGYAQSCSAQLPLPCALARPQAQFAKLNAVLTCQPKGGDECPDRRVEKGLGYVRGLDIPEVTIMELADRLARTLGGSDQFQSIVKQD